MKNLQIFSIVLCVSGLLGTVEGLTEGENITVICTNESISENEIQLLCNLETFICSSMDISQEKFTIDQSSIQLSDGKPVFKAKGEGSENSPLANYSCLSEDGVNLFTVFSTAPDPDTTTVPVSHPGTIYWRKSGTKQQTNTDFQKNESKRKGKKPPRCRKKKKGPKNKGSSEEDRDGQREAECCDGDGKAEEGDEDKGKDVNEPPNNGYARLYTAVTTFAIMAALTVLLLLLAAFCLCRWKKRIQQSTLKAGDANVQKLQEGDCEKKAVTVYAEGTNSGNAVLPPVYNQTGHIYQDIADTPQNSAEVMHNPLYIPNGHPAQEQKLGSQGQSASNGQYSLLQLPV